MISLNNLSVGYGRRTVLHDVTLEFAGGAAGLLGPNGAGKSTLLKTLLGFLPPLAGEARVFDMPLPAAARRVRAEIGYMPETEAFLPGINAVNFVAYMGELSGLPRPAAMERAHEVLQYVGLGESRYRNLDTYSLGMKQRAKLAQAIVHDPRLLLLDEPTNGMDPQGRLEMLDLIRDLATNKGMSIIVCSHLLGDIEFVAGEIIVLGNGRVLYRQVRDEEMARAHVIYLVRVRSNAAAVAERLQTNGIEARADGVLTLVVRLPVQHATREIFAAADAEGTVVRRLEKHRTRLEDVFADALEELNLADL